MPTLHGWKPAKIVTHYDQLMLAVQRVAPQYANVLTATRDLAEFDFGELERASDEVWGHGPEQGSVNKTLLRIQQQYRAAPGQFGGRWVGEAFDNFSSFASKAAESESGSSMEAKAEQTAERVQAVGRKLHAYVERLKVTWSDIADATVDVLIDAVIGAVAGLIAGGPVGAAIGAALGAIFRIVIKSFYELAKASIAMNDEFESFVSYANGLRLPALRGGDWRRQNNVVTS